MAGSGKSSSAWDIVNNPGLCGFIRHPSESRFLPGKDANGLGEQGPTYRLKTSDSPQICFQETDGHIRKMKHNLKWFLLLVDLLLTTGEKVTELVTLINNSLVICK